MAYDSLMLAATSILRTLLSGAASVGVPPAADQHSLHVQKAHCWLLPAASHSATSVAGTAMKLLTCTLVQYFGFSRHAEALKRCYMLLGNMLRHMSRAWSWCWLTSPGDDPGRQTQQ
jgi:hypothetical protein